MKKGFTLVELILVITILGILAVSALPRFIDVTTEAEQASRDGVVGAVRAGIALARADDLVTNGAPGNYPATLDGVADATDCGPTALCYATILTAGVSDANWHKLTDTSYTFSDGTTTFTYTYNPAAGVGTFLSLTAP
jgi:prepilin-type N-terminal cleavage/methylation domain-containing protein